MKNVKGKIINANFKFQNINDAVVTIPIIKFGATSSYNGTSDINGEFNIEMSDDDYNKLIANKFPIKVEKSGFETEYLNIDDYPNLQGMLINLTPVKKNNNMLKYLLLIGSILVLWKITRKK